MKTHRKTTVDVKLFLTLIAACTFLISPVFALASEIDSLLNSSHETSWAYFRDPSQNAQRIWYISESAGKTYALAYNNSGHVSWAALANEGAVASFDFLNKKVSLNDSTAALTPSDRYWAISLVAGEGGEYVHSNSANLYANLITGRKDINMDWYFFRVESTGTWYIVWINGTNSQILRLKLNAAQNNYDWQKPLDGSGVGVDTSNWTKEFFQENGIWKVKFKTPDALAQPIAGSLTVVNEGGFFDLNYNNGVTRYVNGVDQWRQHLGTDFRAAANTPVVSISSGIAVYCNTYLDDPFNSAVIVQMSNGVQVVYGHIISNLVMNTTTGNRNCGTVLENQSLGKVQAANKNSSTYVPHIHMGLNTKGQALPEYVGGVLWGWGRAPYSTTRTDAENRGWVDINIFYNAH